MKTFGILAALSSVVLTFGGLPAQIWTNYERKTCEGFNVYMALAVFIAYTMWSLYGFSKKDIFIKISQPPGAILGFILLGQYVFYDFNKISKSAKVAGVATLLFLLVMLILFLYQPRKR